MGRKFGLFRSYKLGVADVLSMLMLAMLALAAIAVAISSSTVMHPGMVGLGMVVLIILLFVMICVWQMQAMLIMEMHKDKDMIWSKDSQQWRQGQSKQDCGYVFLKFCDVSSLMYVIYSIVILSWK